jgi:molecular chaperone HscC
MILAIDLGTTNSLVAVWKDGQSQLIPNSLGHVLTPSCVSIDERGDLLVGLAARDRLITHPDMTTAAFKRYMGTHKQITLGKKKFRSEELSAVILKTLKADAEAFLGEQVDEAIITVPAYFNDTQRKATRLAGELAGLKVERLLNEPTAAALAYGMHDKEAESQFLVFDLGGGTFDVSILEMFSGVMEVRATSGDNHLGGEDFVTLLVNAFIDQAGKPAGLISEKLSAQQHAKLRTEAERVKRALSLADEATFVYKDAAKEIVWQINTNQFEELVSPLLSRLREPIERALRDAKLRAADLADIVLVGGATRMPIVHRLVAKMLGRFPRRDIDPDEAIASGAAVQAGLKMRDSALDDVVMTDVCPFTLGVETTEQMASGQYLEGVYLPVIERNTVIPASRSQPISPLTPDQKLILLKVYQGESRQVSENVPLGELKIPLAKAKSRNESRSLEVRFTYDINGLLEVEVTELATQKRYDLVIQQTPGAMTDDDVKVSLERLQNLKISPREQVENKALLSRLYRLYEQHLGDTRLVVSGWINAFEMVLEKQDPKEIADIRTKINQYADGLEGKPVL